MKSVNRIRRFPVFLLVLAIISLLPVTTYAEQRVIEKEYTYKASDIDSKISCRAIAIEHVKRLVLEEVGTLVYGKTEVVNYQLESDRISSLTAGIVGIKVLNEKWDGESYYIKAQATVDSDSIAKDVSALLQNQNQVAEIDSINKKVDELLDEVERLKTEIQSMPDQTSQKQEYIARFDDSITQLRSVEMVQDSYVDINAGNYEAATNTLSKAYTLSPVVVGPTVYIARSIVYSRQNKYQQAFKNLDASLRLDPQIAHRVALNRAYVYERSGNKEKALNEINRAILLNPQFAPAYHQRASAYKQQGYLEKARESNLLATNIQKQEQQKLAAIKKKRQEKVKEAKEAKEREARIKKQEEEKKELERQEKARVEERKKEQARQQEVMQQQQRIKKQQTRSQEKGQHEVKSQHHGKQEHQLKTKQQQKKQESKHQKERESWR